MNPANSAPLAAPAAAPLAAPAPAPVNTDADALLYVLVDKARKAERRRLKNRLFAKESRERGKQYFKELKCKFEQLTTDIAAMKTQKAALKADNAALSSAGGISWMLPAPGCFPGAMNE